MQPRERHPRACGFEALSPEVYRPTPHESYQREVQQARARRRQPCFVEGFFNISAETLPAAGFPATVIAGSAGGSAAPTADPPT